MLPSVKAGMATCLISNPNLDLSSQKMNPLRAYLFRSSLKSPTSQYLVYRCVSTIVKPLYSEFMMFLYQVRYLKIVEKSGYQALPWVRYITQNGDDYRCVVTESISFGHTHHSFQVFVQQTKKVLRP